MSQTTWKPLEVRHLKKQSLDRASLMSASDPETVRVSVYVVICLSQSVPVVICYSSMGKPMKATYLDGAGPTGSRVQL